MKVKQTAQRITQRLRALPDSDAARPVDPSEGEQLAREAIAAFREDLEVYRLYSSKKPGDYNPNESPEYLRDGILQSPPEGFTFAEMEQLSRHDPALAAAKWEEVKAAARRDVETGWRSGRALEPSGGKAWERACYLAIRERLHKAWLPRHGGEAMLLDEMAQYEMVRLRWLSILSEMSRFPEAELAFNRRNRTSDRPRTFDAVDSTAEAMRMVERFQRLYQNTLRSLLSMRRGASAFIVQRSGQINVAVGPQANGFRADDAGEACGVETLPPCPASVNPLTPTLSPEAGERE